MKYIILLLISAIFQLSCNTSTENNQLKESEAMKDTLASSKLVKSVEDSSSPKKIQIPDTAIVELKAADGNFVFNMKYATKDNFLNEQLYDCPKCLLRKKTVDALIKAGELAKSKGYKIMLFDCYRPLYIQKKMWEIVNDPRYVANPKTGSIHNRGGAVDLTLTDMDGKPLDMGTKFDHFGKEAHHSFENISSIVKQNRTLLKELMIESGFVPLNSEWWHYSLPEARKYTLGNTPIVCEK